MRFGLGPLSDLERAVLEEIARQGPDHAAALREQISSTLVVNRKNTGAGFFTKLRVSEVAPGLFGVRPPMGVVEAHIDSMEYPMGFSLWIEHGWAETLEGFTVGEDSTEDRDLVGLRFSNLGPWGSGNK